MVRPAARKLCVMAKARFSKNLPVLSLGVVVFFGRGQALREFYRTNGFSAAPAFLLLLSEVRVLRYIVEARVVARCIVFQFSIRWSAPPFFVWNGGIFKD